MEEVKQEKNSNGVFKTTKKVFKIIFSIIFWTAFAVVIFTWISDYLNVRAEKKPSFCISRTTHTFDDGTVEECDGLGYKVYDYKRASMSDAVEFVPFFANMRESSK